MPSIQGKAPKGKDPAKPGAVPKARNQALRLQLEELLRRFPPTARVGSDPVSFPRALLREGRSRQEIEAVALLAAMLAYGAVPLFMRVIRGILAEAGESFLGAITPPTESKPCPTFSPPRRENRQAPGPRVAPRESPTRHRVTPRAFSLGYRLSTAAEISHFCAGIGAVISRHGGLWEAFAFGWDRERTVRAGLTSLHAALWTELGHPGGVGAPHGLRHLLPDPQGGGCVKRWQMFLRWMVRPDDGVDLGLWPAVPPGALLMPLDRHISRIARNLGLTTRRSDDWKTAEEVTAALRLLDPADPVRYDFALCHLGIAGDCTHGSDPDRCRVCILRRTCATGKRP